jgi:hypothetical protein
MSDLLFYWPFVSGTIYKDDCPYQRLIPIYLIVGGSVLMVLQLLAFLRIIAAKYSENPGGALVKYLGIIEVTVVAFSLIWFFAGERIC